MQWCACLSIPTARRDPLRERADGGERSNDEEHTTFWLIVADPFAKAVVCDRVRQKAVAMIDADEDFACSSARHDEVRPTQAAQDAEEVRARIVATTVGKPRTVLAKPQPLYGFIPKLLRPPRSMIDRQPTI